MFSLFCGVALIPVIYLLGKELFKQSVGLLAAVLVALNLFQIQYSQEARAYSLVVLLVTNSSLLFVRFLKQQSTTYWIAYVVVSALAVYAHIFAVLVLGAQVASLIFLS